jgi:hypothetical protein
VNETARWVCSGAFSDPENAIMNVCFPQTSEHRNETVCGDYLMELDQNRGLALHTISELPLNQSCTYRVHTQCGYPSALYTSEQDISGEYDISWTTAANVTTEDDLNTWDFKWTSPQSGSHSSGLGVSQNNITYSGLKVPDEDYLACNGTN